MKKEVIFGDCMDIMNDIPKKSIDFIFADLPYGTTKCKWDSTLPLNDYIKVEYKPNKYKILYYDEFIVYMYKLGNIELVDKIWKENSKKGLWSHYNRIIKDNGCIALFGQTPFDKVLGNSNKKMLKYEWIWEKTSPTGHLNAKKMPMKAHENILIFYKNIPIYNPQKTTGHIRKVSKAEHKINCIESEVYNKGQKLTTYDSTERYPRSVQTFASDKQKSKLHPTQKPLELVKYFINTYTNEGDIVLDNVAGSGTTGVGCDELNRQYILIENDKKSYDLMLRRINNI